MGLLSKLGFGGGGSNTQSAKVWKDQIPYLQGLYRQAQNLQGTQQGSIGGYADQLARNLMNPQGGYAVQNPYISQQIAGLGQDMGNMFQNQILPGIQSSAGIAGQFGGSRQGVAAGLAGQDLMSQFSRAATDIRSNAYNNTMQMLPQLYDLGMSRYTAPWMPIQNASATFGPPTVLGGASSSTNPGFFNNMFSGFFQCAAAREAFGPDNLEWITFFAWKELAAPEWFRKAYNRHAEKWAALIRGREPLKAATRWLMRRLAR